MKRRCMHVGLGSLGSYAYKAIEETFFPAKSILIDPDVVAEHNIYNSAFKLLDIGRPKVSVLSWGTWGYIKLSKKFEDVVLEKLFPSDTASGLIDLSCDIIICAVDSMQTRKNIFEYFKTEPTVELFVDLRGSKDQIRVYVISRDDIQFYEDRFYPDSEVIVEGCEAVISSFNAKICSTMMLEELKKYFLREDYRRELIFDSISLNLLCENIKKKEDIKPDLARVLEITKNLPSLSGIISEDRDSEGEGDGAESGINREVGEGQNAKQLSGEENNSGSEEGIGKVV